MYIKVKLQQMSLRARTLLALYFLFIRYLYNIFECISHIFCNYDVLQRSNPRVKHLQIDTNKMSQSAKSLNASSESFTHISQTKAYARAHSKVLNIFVRLNVLRTNQRMRYDAQKLTMRIEQSTEIRTADFMV